MEGFIHSTESFGTVDGPGVRFVVFCQGCPLRCKYCHNPDTWAVCKGERMSAQEIIARFERNRAFYTNGGITVTGGEPLLQIDFLLELFELAKKKHIHTCLDTSGITFRAEDGVSGSKLDRLMDYTDLVMLDIKHIDRETHRELTGMYHDNAMAFAHYLDRRNIPVWIRHVVVPGVTDDETSLDRLGAFIGTLRNVKALDVLPYHTMGVEKYRQMGMTYPLEGVGPMDEEGALRAKKIILQAIVRTRREENGAAGRTGS